MTAIGPRTPLLGDPYDLVNHVTEVTALGPFSIRRGDAVVDVGGPRPRHLIAALLSRPDVAVSRDELVRELWQERPPRTAIETLHSYVSRLRRALGESGPTIVTLGQGYAVRVADVWVDAWAFDQEVALGSDELRSGAAERALRTLSAALGRWRGSPYAGLERGEIVASESARLVEQRASALEDRIDATLLVGRLAPLVPELEGLVHGHPLRERLHAQRMLALYRAGRQAAALEAFQDARRRLVEDLGVEPGPLLQRVQTLILQQDPSLERVTTLDLEPARPVLASVQPAVLVDRSASAAETAAAGEGAQEPGAAAGTADADPELVHLCGLVRRHRLVSVTAPSGAGKTQLLLRSVPMLRSVATPVRVVSLDDRPGIDPLEAIGQELGIHPSLTAIAEALDGGVLGFDLGDGDVDAAARGVAALLARAPRLRIVVVARERLRLPEEHRWRLPLLGVPPAGATLDVVRAAPAAVFFARCVRRWHPYFEIDEHNHILVARIVRALEGLPLGLSLAAEQLETMAMERLVEAVEADPGALRGRMRAGAPRHRSLAEAITTLTEPLTDAQRRLLASLHVFSGGFTPDAVAAVCGETDDDRLSELASLLDGSSLAPVPTTTGTIRYQALPFLDRPAPDVASRAVGDDLATRHSEHYVSLAERAAPHLTGPSQVHWLNRMHEEHDNLRAVLDRSIHRGDLASAARVTGALTWFWLLFGHGEEGIGWVRRLEAAGDDAIADLDPAARARYRLGAARLLTTVGERSRSRDLLHAAVEDAAAADGPRDQLAVALAALAGAMLRRRDTKDAERLLDEAANVAGDDALWAAASIADVRSAAVRSRGDHEASRALLATAERYYHDSGDEWNACLSRLRSARLAAIRGNVEAAARLHRTNLARAIELTATTFDFVGLPRDLHGLAALARRAGYVDVATRLREVAGRLTVGPVVHHGDGYRHVHGHEARDVVRSALDDSAVLVS